ncbi:hypothetical protein KIPB_000219 [Kipferlia bialata]|uniref:Uncharacterized protein n=1 Tax=Kipferlia bialata TaxID=797122 RepID=A0A9K3GDA2_9EUKA|nr:hypothetical protein KIPB_000219 [Kipferlia bialata]|eukprot:g219.t1
MAWVPVSSTVSSAGPGGDRVHHVAGPSQGDLFQEHRASIERERQRLAHRRQELEKLLAQRDAVLAELKGKRYQYTHDVPASPSVSRRVGLTHVQSLRGSVISDQGPKAFRVPAPLPSVLPPPPVWDLPDTLSVSAVRFRIGTQVPMEWGPEEVQAKVSVAMHGYPQGGQGVGCPLTVRVSPVSVCAPGSGSADASLTSPVVLEACARSASLPLGVYDLTLSTPWGQYSRSVSLVRHVFAEPLPLSGPDSVPDSVSDKGDPRCCVRLADSCRLAVCPEGAPPSLLVCRSEGVGGPGVCRVRVCMDLSGPCLVGVVPQSLLDTVTDTPMCLSDLVASPHLMAVYVTNETSSASAAAVSLPLSTPCLQGVQTGDHVDVLHDTRAGTLSYVVGRASGGMASQDVLAPYSHLPPDVCVVIILLGSLACVRLG